MVTSDNNDGDNDDDADDGVPDLEVGKILEGKL